MNRKNMYAEFGSKQELFEAALDIEVRDSSMSISRIWMQGFAMHLKTRKKMGTSFKARTLETVPHTS